MAKAVTIYGIKNCDTMKKARAWLDKRGVTYEFHDYKSAGIERSMLEGWARQAGWEALINRAGRTFRALPEKDQVGLTEKKAIALMAAQPSMIRRPVLTSAASCTWASSRSSTRRNSPRGADVLQLCVPCVAAGTQRWTSVPTVGVLGEAGTL